MDLTLPAQVLVVHLVNHLIHQENPKPCHGRLLFGLLRGIDRHPVGIKGEALLSDGHGEPHGIGPALDFKNLVGIP